MKKTLWFQDLLLRFVQYSLYIQDSELANHLNNINFTTDMFLLPWFLLWFSQDLKLKTCIRLWDNLLYDEFCSHVQRKSPDNDLITFISLSIIITVIRYQNT